jgi:murein endopeptidase
MPEAGAIDIKSKNIQPPTHTTSHYRALSEGQTVCTVKDEKGQNCSGHVKQWFTAPPEVRSKAAPGNTIHRCQRCNTIYEGPAQEYLQPKKTLK